VAALVVAQMKVLAQVQAQRAKVLQVVVNPLVLEAGAAVQL
jgi:hypothetical protein